MSSNLPTPVRSPYAQDKPNDKISIAQGEGRLEIGGTTIYGDIKIEAIWHGVPSSRFTFTPVSNSPPLPPQNNSSTRLIINYGKINLDTSVLITETQLDFNGTTTVCGILNGRAAAPNTEVSKIRAPIFNFRQVVGTRIGLHSKTQIKSWPGRLVLPDTDWNITIDENENAFSHENKPSNGDIWITHTLEIKKKHNQTFPTDEAEGLLAAIRLWLSFCAGSFSSPALAIGLDKDNSTIWQEFSIRCFSPWYNSTNWLPTNYAKDVTSLFPLLKKISENTENAEPLAYAIHWYISANRLDNGQEGSIAFAQIALELLSHWCLVEINASISSDGLNKLSASDKTRLLLSQKQISLDIPCEFSELIKPIKNLSISDGPEAITYVRNSLVHPTSKNRGRIQKFDGLARHQALQLSLLYIELSILHTLGYKGSFFDRTKHKWAGEKTSVPWATPC